MTHRTKLCHCPHCDKPIDAATDISGGDAMPKPNDYTVCLYCAQPMVFDANITPRKLTADEQRNLPHQVRDLMAMIRKHKTR